MQIQKLMIFDLASDTQTYLYAACRQAKDIGEKKQQRHRAESKESDDEGGNPDSDRSFLVHPCSIGQPVSMRRMTLRIIPVAISNIGIRWKAATNKGNIIFGHCASPTILGRQSITDDQAPI